MSNPKINGVNVGGVEYDLDIDINVDSNDINYGTGTVKDALDTQGKKIETIHNALSHVGMIVQSTTLDTEAKVKAIYGAETSWSKIEGRVLVGDGTLDSAHSYTAGDVGGEPEHKLTINEMPKHTHNYSFPGHDRFNGGQYEYNAIDTANRTYATTATGGDGAHNNMPPYKVVYIWERTA